MPPKRAEKRLDLADPQVCLMPIELSGSPEINQLDAWLTIDDPVIGAGGAYYAKLHYLDERTDTCVAVRRKMSAALDIFQILNACSHQNIAKPIGVWEDKVNDKGYIAFRHFDGVLSTVPKEIIFEVENPSEPDPAIYGFSKIGLNILSDIMSAVNYVNNKYQQETTQTENYIPLRSLRIEAGTIFYQLKEGNDYLVLLSDFEMGTGGTRQNVKGRRKKKGKGEEPDVHEISTRNWNNTGKYIAQLYGGWRANFEVSHLVDTLQEEAVRYIDLVWEAGLWDLSTKIYFLREIFWCYDNNTTRKADLIKRKPLELQNCIVTLEFEETTNEGNVNQSTKIMQETNLLKSLVFLRSFIFAHRAEILKRYTGPKDAFQDEKSAERFVLKHKGDYMVRLIQEIRSLAWIKTSPYLRSRNNYMIERHRPSKK